MATNKPQRSRYPIYPNDRLLTFREVAALKRANLETVRSFCRKNFPLIQIGRRKAVWLSQVIDAAIPYTLTEDQAASLVAMPDAEHRKMHRRNYLISHRIGFGQDPEIASISTKSARSEVRRLKKLTGQTPPLPTGYRYSSLQELDLAAVNYRKAQEGYRVEPHKGFSLK